MKNFSKMLITGVLIMGVFAVSCSSPSGLGNTSTYSIIVTMADNSGTDSVNVMRSSGRPSDIIRIYYKVDSSADHNFLDFSGVGSAITSLTGAGLWDYTLNTADAVNGVITIRAVFIHFDTGNGSSGNPFNVYDAATLKKVGAETGAGGWVLGAHYRQMRNINMNGKIFTPIGIDNPNRFTGSYDGNGYTISNLTINNPTADYQGIFGVVGTGAVIDGVGLIGGSVTGNQYVGGIVGLADIGSTIQNCYVAGAVSGSGYAGGVAGAASGTLQNCYAMGIVSCTSYPVGGVAGFNGGTLQNCYFTGEVSGNQYVGGIVGYTSSFPSVSTVQNCYTTGVVSGNQSVGGVVGGPFGTIQNCAALNHKIAITDMNAAYIGRVVGQVISGTLTKNYALSGMTLTYGGGIYSYVPSPGLSTKDGVDVSPESTVTPSWWTNPGNWNGGAWDFTAVWEWSIGKSLPILRGLGGQ